MDRFEADLASRPLADLRIERPGEELSSEADTEERDPTIQRLSDHLCGFLDERLLVGVPHVERGTEDDDAVDPVETRPRTRTVERIPHLDLPARNLYGGRRDPERLRGITSHEQDHGHVADSSRGLTSASFASPGLLWHTSVASEYLGTRQERGGRDDGQ